MSLFFYLYALSTDLANLQPCPRTYTFELAYMLRANLSFPSSILLTNLVRLLMALFSFIKYAHMVIARSFCLRIHANKQFRLKPIFNISPATYV
jgi:hypothetical protein